MQKENQIKLLKTQISAGNNKQAFEAVSELIKLDPLAIDHLISLLDDENASIRDRGAIGLNELGNKKALEPLFRVINKPDNVNNRGTLVYALAGIDCSDKLNEVFDLLFYGNAEVKMGATSILDQQTFEFTKNDLLLINDKWLQLQAEPELCPYYNTYKNQMEDLVSSFLKYLQE